jgi:ABC-type branched-subunit amino acid transport system ATPase component
MSRFIRERQAQGAAFVIVEQNLAFLLPTMDQALVLDHGECVLAGVAADLPRSALEAHLAV